MKKFIVAVLALVMLLAVAATASAGTANTAQFTIYNAPCEAISDSDLYKHFGTDSCVKHIEDNEVQMKHKVTQIDAGETNRMAAYDITDGMTMGAHWHPSDYRYYPITSNAIDADHEYTGAGRGNTNYASKYGLNKITITGILDPDQD